MAIIKYREQGLSSDVSVRLAEISQYSLRAKAMLTALGDYWTNYYRNLDPIAAATTGSVAAVSKEYTHILDMVRASNILDVPIQQSDQFDLLVINYADVRPIYADDGSIAYYFVPLADVVDTRYLTTSLFESRVVLERGVHFDVLHGKGYKFYVDVFNDTGITGYAYEVGDASERHVLLWACDIAFSSTVIYERYGRFLYKKSIDGEQYKWLVSALMHFYENAKTVKCIQDVLNIMYGIPYTRFRDEVVQDIYYVDTNLQPLTRLTEEPYICIETDKANYYTYAFSTVLYKKGDVIPQFSLLADFNKVEDYVSHPNWWEDTAFPSSLISGVDMLTADQKNELMDKVLKYNTVHISIGISYDTYETYLNQVKELFNIIESGFPVYLYPLVDSFFRAVFIDKFEIEDEFEKMRLAMGMESHYDWGDFLKFDGSVNYYMDPEYDYGRHAVHQDVLFDGSAGYYIPDKHNGRETDVIIHVGSNDYTTGWRYSHDNDREELRITNVSQRMDDAYPWDTAPTMHRYDLTYANLIHADGGHVFGETGIEIRNEHISVAARCKPFSDFLPLPSESADLHVRTSVRAIEDILCGANFNGCRSYDGGIPVAQTAYAEALTVSCISLSGHAVPC
jgi:hypothetical protein